MTYAQRKAREKRRNLKHRALAVIAVDRAEDFADTARRNVETIGPNEPMPRILNLHRQADTARVALANARMWAAMHGGPVR